VIEPRYVAAALPKLYVVTINELLSVLFGRVIVRTKKLDRSDETTVYANDVRSVLCHRISSPSVFPGLDHERYDGVCPLLNTSQIVPKVLSRRSGPGAAASVVGFWIATIRHFVSWKNVPTLGDRAMRARTDLDFLLYPLATEEEPVCPACGKPMTIALHEARHDRPDFSTFKCLDCTRSERFVLDN
jgi:hypothetical protein